MPSYLHSAAPETVATVNFVASAASQYGVPSTYDSQVATFPARRDAQGRALVERASTNLIPAEIRDYNSAAVGVQGAGGALPSRWTETNVAGTTIKYEVVSKSADKLTIRVFKTDAVTSARDFLINMPARGWGWTPGAGSVVSSVRVRVVEQSANFSGIRLSQNVHQVVDGVTTTLRGASSGHIKAGQAERVLSARTEVNAGELVNIAVGGSVPVGQEASTWSVTFEISQAHSEFGQTSYDFTTFTGASKPLSTAGIHIPPGTYTALVHCAGSPSGISPYGNDSNNGGQWHDNIVVTGNGGWSVPVGAGTKYVEQIHVFKGRLTSAQKSAVSDLIDPLKYGGVILDGEDFRLNGRTATLTTPEKSYSYLRAPNRRSLERWEIRQGEHYIGDNPERPSAERAQRTEWMDYKSPVPWRVPVWHTMQIKIEPGTAGPGLNKPASLIVGQWHATEDDLAGGGRETAREPVAGLWLNSDDQIRFDIRWTDVKDMQTTTPLNPRTVWEAHNFPRGQWVHLLQKVTFDWAPAEQGGIGHTELWCDGEKVVDVVRPIGYNDMLGPHWKQGLYRSAGTNFGRAVAFYANSYHGTTDLSHLIGNPPPIS